ncbi:MAG: FluC/FEX family fluoride channel [Actinomycetes bacterium]
MGLVILGGTAGTAVRDRIETLFATPPGGFPWATLAINVSGAFLLGALLELLVLAPEGGRRALQLALGTGLLGGYTTYSTFVLETVGLGSQGAGLTAAVYAVGSALAGFVAAFASMGITRALVRALEGSER